MAEPGRPIVCRDSPQAQPDGKERAEAVVAGDSGPAKAHGEHRVSGHDVSDDESCDTFTEHLAACAERLEHATAPWTPVAETLPQELRADLEPAVDCLRLLKELRRRRATESA